MNYCTYFDHRYLPRGLAMHSSLLRHSPNATLWVLCLSQRCEQILAKLNLPGIRAIPLRDLETFDADLAACRNNRTLIEYYFTCSPCLPLYVLDLAPEARAITYVDADIFFFSTPDPVFSEIGTNSVGITPHRYSPAAQRSHGKYGTYNVGWLTFKRDADGIACLEWWRQQCLEWCHDRVDGDRYADQKYLDQFPHRFPGVHSIRNAGANLAPWNVAGHAVSRVDQAVIVDGEPLIFFHFQGLRALTQHWYDSNLTGYGARMTGALREAVFKPYVAELAAIERDLLRRGFIEVIEPGVRRRSEGLKSIWRALTSAARTLRSIMSGNVFSSRASSR